MSDQENTPGADSPLPEEAGTSAAFPDLSAHSDAPAWLSGDGSHDTGLWERSFAGSGDAAETDAPPAEPADAVTPAAAASEETEDNDDAAAASEETEDNDDAGEAGEAQDNDDAGSAETGGEDVTGAEDAEPSSTDEVELPPEPVVVAPEELELAEPSLAEPALSSDAVEAVALDEVASETAAVEANAAEAGRLSGLEPAPAGAEIRVDPGAAGAEPQPESTTQPASPAAAIDGDGSSEPVAEPADEPVAGNGDEEAASEEAAAEEPASQEAAPDAAPSEERASEEAAVEEAVPDEAPSEEAKEAEASAADDAAAEEPAPKDAVEGPEPKEAQAEEQVPGPLHGIDAAAPLTGALPEQDKAETAPEPEPATASIPTGDTRRSRRLAESQAAAAAGASAARKPSGKTEPASQAPPEPGAPVPATASAPDKGTGSRNTKLVLVIGGVALAAVAAILLVVFVFNAKGEGVLSENVSPVELETGACLQDWEDVNSTADVVTCETPHDAQLVASERFEDSDTFPGTAALEDRVNEVCDAVNYNDAASSYPDLKVAKSIPTEQTWSNGDRRLDCFVFSPEGQELTESLIRQ